MTNEILVPELKGLDFSRFKGQEWREGQDEIVSRIINSSAPFVIAQAPTGVGKSLIAMAGAKLIEPKRAREREDRDRNRYYLTPQSGVLTGTKQLQAQYLGDFNDWAREVKGRGNFPCLEEEGVSAADALCTLGNPCSLDCPYPIQRDVADASPMVIHSYAMFLNSANYAGRFNENSLLVLDEAHLLDDMLMAFVSSTVTERVAESFGIAVPKDKYGWKFLGWQGWARANIDRLQDKLDDLMVVGVFDIEQRKRYKAGKSLLDTMYKLSTSNTPWVVESTQFGWEFKPIWIGALADQYLYRHGTKKLLMSATVLNPRIFAEIVGIDPEETEFIDVPSSFPIGRKPVFYTPVNAVNKDSDKGPLVAKVWDIVQDHKGEKGLVHAVSYELAKAIMECPLPEVRRRLRTHGASDRLAVYEAFRESSDDLVLVSPSMKEGVSLEDDQCRFIIVPKMPYPYLGSPQIKARMDTDLGQRWYPWKTFCDFMQMCGRGMRSAEDSCVVYVLDANFRRTYKQMYRYVPDYWKADLHDIGHYL